MSEQEVGPLTVTKGPVQINWQAPEQALSRYATNIVCQFTGNEYVLSFFEAKWPIETAPAGETLKQDVREVNAECVARVIIAKERMRVFADLMNKVIDQQEQQGS